MLIGISGRARSGKDTTADYLVQNYGFTKVAFADDLKEKCKTDFDLSDEQLHGNLKDTTDYRYNKTPREIMQTIGRFYRSINANFWVDKCFNKLLLNKNYVLPDVRMPNEHDAIKKLNGLVWRVERSDELRGVVSNPNDISETSLEYYSFDLKLNNNGTFVYLYNQIDNWMINHDLY